MTADGPFILLVDDEPAILALLSDLLAGEGYATRACQSGREALAVLQRERPCLVIVDLQMERRDSGLGQLAFDKGIRILAATQADDVALEDARLGQGLLTYALAVDGFAAGAADLDGDGSIRIDEWLAQNRVFVA